MPQFDRDRNEVLNRASEAGVHVIFTVGTDVTSSQQVLALSHQNPSIYAVVGIHPHNAKNLDQASLDQMREIAQDSRVRAYGEIGLDFFRNLSPPETQIEAFQEQIRLARELELPIVIHDRQAHEDVVRILREEGGENLQAVFHCFSGDLTMAEEVINMGFYLSVPGTITFPKARQIREVIRKIPLDRILIETDCPYLSPEPYRGMRNEPSYVRCIAEKIAEIKTVPFETVGAVTSKNAALFFQIDGEVQ
jgi:TatD DNase family protein